MYKVHIIFYEQYAFNIYFIHIILYYNGIATDIKQLYLICFDYSA